MPLEHPDTNRRRIRLHKPHPPVQLHTIVSPTSPIHNRTENERHFLYQQILDRCHRSTEPLSVGEIAATAEVPVGPVCVAVSDLLHERILWAHDSKTYWPLTHRLALERVRTHLEQGRPVETAKIVALGHAEEIEAFLSHLSPHTRLALSPGVESSVSRLEHDLYLFLVVAHHHHALEEYWPDLMRETDAAMLMARSDRLHEARKWARALNSRQVPFHTVVHLADETTDLDAEHVLEELGLSAAAPVVMVDVHSPTAPVTVLRDLCTRAPHEEGVHT